MSMNDSLSNPIIIIVDTNIEERIDKYLSSLEFLNLSRSRIKTLIDTEKVLINNKPAKPSSKINLNDKILLYIENEPKEYTVKAQDIEIDIIYEDKDLAIINKSADMVVHPAPGNYENTLVNALLHHIKDLSGINGVKRPGIVHRLDKDTSGLLIIAKNDTAHNKLSDMIKNREIKRKYLALTWGITEKNFDTIETYFGRHQTNRLKMAVLHEGRKAITHYSVIKRYDFCELLECSLETGRTHQIRVHMKYIKHPIIGDRLYGEDEGRLKSLNNKYITKAKAVVNCFKRQALHAYKLEFLHPITNKELIFTAELPDDFKNALEILEK